jgi:hypothetical protein
MTNFIRNFVNDEQGRDTIGGALFLGIAGVVGLALLSGIGIGGHGMWATSAVENLAIVAAG